MAQKGVLIAPYFLINAVDLTQHAREINYSYTIEGQEDTESGDTSRTESPGLQVNSFDITFNQDFAAPGAGAVDATIAAIGRTVVAVEWRHDSAAVAPTNPKWTGSVFVKAYNPTAGKIGDMSIARLSLGFNTAVTRATA